MALRLTFIGPPGSGKGTQAKLLRREGFLHLSSGDMLRAEIAAGTPLGRSLAATMAAGALVDDAVLFQVVGAFLAQHRDQSIVLDGYPRTLPQARQLESLGLHAAVFFEIPDAVILRRLGDRVIGPDGTIYDLQLHPPPPGLPVTRRADDDPAVHQTRLAAYRAQESELRAFYQTAGLVRLIRAELPLPEVQAQVRALIADLSREFEGVPAR
ncbi:MAG TPA: nucleoside monophosphate kinase [Terriglobales bacterium]|nr:nucleoside monophosphate kinase [Terriglobales bacterium]